VGLGGELSFGGWFVGPIPVGPWSVKKPGDGIIRSVQRTDKYSRDLVIGYLLRLSKKSH
jgi:hypothetical protein